MTSFLAELAHTLIHDSNHPLQQQVVVLPSSRACNELKRQLGIIGNSTLFLPEITTIDQWLDSHHPHRCLKGEEQSLALFESLSSAFNVQWDDYLKWVKPLLSDFKDVYGSLLDARDVFTNLRQVRELENWEVDAWSFDDTEDQGGDGQKRFEQFWQMLPGYFEAFDAYQNQMEVALPQKIAADFATGKYDLQVADIPTIWFCGFNALSSAEKAIIQRLEKSNRARVAWDYDPFYMQPWHEAGLFVRRNIQEFGTGVLARTDSWFRHSNRNVHIHTVSGDQMQAATVSHILQQVPPHELTETAVILSDEAVLPVLMDYLPALSQPCNISMGYPCRMTGEWAMLALVIRMYETAIQDKQGQPLFFSNDVIALLENPIIGTSSDNVSGKFRFVSSQRMKELLRPDFRFLADALSDGLSLVNRLLTLISQMRQTASQQQNAILSGLEKAMEPLAAVLERYPFANTPHQAAAMIRRAANTATADIKGEKHTGVQIMGVLESRLLDFKRVIFVSLNEGIMPGLRHEQGFIPYDLRHYFGLSTKKEFESIYAYNFYRINARTAEVHLVCLNGKSDDLQSGEPSRYIPQLKHDLGGFSNVRFEAHSTSLQVSLPEQRLRTVEKDAFVMERLKVLANSGFSPSAVHSYINCPVDFYHKYVLGLEEEKEVDEVSDDRFGTMVHKSLEVLYTPFIGQALTREGLLGAQKKLRDTVSAVFSEELRIKGPFKGKQLLNFEVAAAYVQRVIDWDLQRVRMGIPVIIMGLEQQLEMSVSPPAAGIDRLKLKGNIDRIEQSGNRIQLMDYKTGSVKPYDLKVQQPEEVFQDAQRQKQLQLLWYSMLQLHNGSDSVASSILSLRNISSGPFNLSVSGSESFSATDLEWFEQGLQQLLLEIFNPEIPFTQNPEPTYRTVV
jgi:hypothetical protein